MPQTEQTYKPVLQLRGDYGVMGHQHGCALSDKVGQMVEHYVGRSEEIYEVPTPYLLRESKRCLPFIPKRFIEEMEGIASGSDVSMENILALNCLADVDGCYMQGLLHCCNFVLSHPVTRGGLFCHGRNLDFPNAGGVLAELAVAVSRMPSNGAIPTFAVTFPGFVGILTGYSRAKLTAAEVGVPDKGASIDGAPIALLLRDILERAENTDQAFEIARDAPRTCGFNLAVSDGNVRNGIAIEMTRRLCERRSARNGVLVVDNVSFCRNTAKNRLTHAAGAFRHARIIQLISESRGAIDTEVTRGILSDNYDVSRARANPTSYNCICNHHTIHSVLFLPAEGRLLLAHGAIPAPSGGYVEYTDEDIWAKATADS